MTRDAIASLLACHDLELHRRERHGCDCPDAILSLGGPLAPRSPQRKEALAILDSVYNLDVHPEDALERMMALLVNGVCES